MTLLKNILLALTSIILGVILIPSGIFYALIFFIFRLDKEITLKYFERLFLYIAISIDMIGNFACAILFNSFLLKKNESRYRFGKVGETISSALGKNVIEGNLSIVGVVLNGLLNLFEKDHSIKSIVDNK